MKVIYQFDVNVSLFFLASTPTPDLCNTTQCMISHPIAFVVAEMALPGCEDANATILTVSRQNKCLG